MASDSKKMKSAARLLRGSVKSLSMRVGFVMVVLPHYWPSLEPELAARLPGIIGKVNAATVIQLLGLLVWGLRLKTNQSLWDKGAKP